MNVTIANAQKAECFAGIFQHMKSFSEHIVVLFEEERMYIQAMDGSRISIVEVVIPSAWFQNYDLTDGGRSMQIGVNSSILYRVLNARDKTQRINLVVNNAEDDKLSIHFTPIGDVATTGNAEFDKHFEIALIDVDSEFMAIPEMEYQAEFSLSSSNFANIINQLKMFGDNLDLVCSENKIVLCSNSVEQGKMFVEIKIDDLSSFIIDEGETIHASFSLNCLHNICLYNKLSKEVEVKFKNNFPMKVVYPLIGGLPDAKMIFYLAPRIADDE